jgi:hypothetical protein
MEMRLNRAIDAWNMVEKSGQRKARNDSMRWMVGMGPACCCSVRWESIQQP